MENHFLDILGVEEKEQYMIVPEFNMLELKNNAFVNETFFNAATRNLKPNELFFMLMKNIKNFEEDNLLLFGFLTVLCYRIADDFEKRRFIIKYLDAIYHSIEITKCDKATFSRWFISASNTLGTMQIMCSNINNAMNIFHRALREINFIPHTPLYSMNYSMISFQTAMIYMYNNENQYALIHFERCFIESKRSIDEILNTRNDWFLGMYTDIDILSKLSKNSMIASTFIKKNSNNNIEGTRFLDMNGNLTQFDALLPIHRYGIKEKLPKDFYIHILNLLKKKLK